MIDLLRDLRHAIEDHLPSQADLEVVGVVVLYALAVIWLTRLWHTRHQARRRHQPDRGLAFMDGVVRLLRVVVLLVVRVLLALARAAGARTAAAGRTPVGLPIRPHVAGPEFGDQYVK